MQQHTQATYKKPVRLISVIILCGLSTLCIPAKLAAQSCIHTLEPHNTFYTDNCATPTLAAAVAAANTEGGGTVYVTTPGTYTISSTLILGSALTRVQLYLGPKVVLNCTMTNGSNCIVIYDASGIHGPAGFTAQQLNFGSNPYITLSASAHVANVITNAVQDGSQQTATIDGVEVIGASGATVDQAMIHMRGLFSGTSLRNTGARKLYSTIGILLDTPGGVTNSTATLITPAAVSGSGTTISITVPASTTATPDGHLVWAGGKINLANCSGGTGTYNGTNLVVASILDNTHFTVSAPGSVSGSPTGCTYSPVNVQNITSVYHMENIVISGGQTGSRPLVISTNGAGALGDIWCHSCDIEGADAGLAEIELNGNGSNTGLQEIGFYGLRLEGRGDANASTIGMKIRDASNINVFGVAGGNQIGTAGQSLFDISQSSSQHTYNINIYGIVDQGWANVINNQITGVTRAASNSGGNKTASYAQYHYAGTNWDGTAAGVVISE